MQNPEIIVRKYKNRKLYNTATSSYMTIPEISKLFMANENVKVLDYNQNDITYDVYCSVVHEQNKSYGKAGRMTVSDLQKQLNKFKDLN